MISNFGSPRDTAFWPWHKHVQYFGRLAAARFPQDLTAHKAAVTLSELDIRMQADTRRGGLNTFLGPPASNLMESLAKLDHAPYLWSVNVVSTLSPRPTPKKPQVVTLRFFIAAKQLMEDYHNWIEMDKVSITLTSGEVKFNIRFDKDSSVARKMGNYSELDPDFASAWCRCGWPQNMMLPVGKPEGMTFVAFCIATNDAVSDDVKAPALSYCGAMNSERKYPDPRGMGYPFNQVWTQHIEPDKDGRNAKLSDIITDSATYPFLTTTEFEIYRNTKPFLSSEIDPPPVPVGNITWYDTIQKYFLPGDVTCMKFEYGYDLSDYDDVMLHSGAIYDACSNKRMPLQMPPFTQDNPDPDHPMWSQQMCDNFKIWMFNGCPKGKDPNPPPPPPPLPRPHGTTPSRATSYLATWLACRRA
ncbi:Hemocyanin, ig-like domain-containing protein [Coprinopsis sp. MPI-PUGE-AT-0042]|nr:Hemocyanin, ig-like domain-containing protein [Coprinopsis sp. MPI-PUGE-AT-0042]